MTDSELKRIIAEAKSKGYSDEEIVEYLRTKVDDNSMEKIITSGIIGAITGSTIIGGLLGGSFLGGFVGDLLEGTDDSWF